MQDLRDRAIAELTSQGRSEAGFLRALPQVYGLFGIGQALDFAAVAAWWQGAPLAPEWRRELAVHTRLDERESGWRGRSLCAALQSWMLQDQPPALWRQIGERCVLLLAPFLGAIPTGATAPALILVGSLMVSHVSEINWRDPLVAIPAFLTLVCIPLTFSIANGLALGFIAYAALRLFSGRGHEVNWLVYVLAALFVVRFVYLGGE